MIPHMRAAAVALALCAFTLNVALGGQDPFDDSPDQVQKRPGGSLGSCVEFDQIRLTGNLDQDHCRTAGQTLCAIS
jgi:hypothetical protein